MTILSNVSLAMPNSSVVFTSQSAYTSMELYYTIIALFSIFMLASFFLDGSTRPFEKLLASIMAFVLSVWNAMSSFSLAIVTTGSGGNLQDIINNITYQSIIPTIIMQNDIKIQIVTWIFVLLCFVNIINCILVLIDYSRVKGGKKSEF